MSKLKVSNPATGELIQELNINTNEEIKTAIDHAGTAFDSWKKVDAFERARLLKKWSELILENKLDIAKTITLENGKPLKEALGEVAYATDYIEWYAEEAKRIYGRTIPANQNA